MKSLAVIKKNLKLLIRSKGSALIVLLAPLIIVLVIGIGFSDTSTPPLNIGIHAKDTSELTNRYVNNLNTTENELMMFEDQQRCVESVKEGVVVACIVFPENFILATDKKNEVLFFIDESRINLVYRLIASLTFNLDLETSEVSKELTTKMLEIMSRSADEVDNSISTIIAMKASTQTSKETAGKSSSSLSNLDVEEVNVDLSSLTSDIASLGSDFKSVKSKGKDVLEAGYELIDDLSNGSATNDLENAIDDLNRSITDVKLTDKDVDDLIAAVNTADKSVKSIQSKLSATRNIKSSVLADVNTLTSNLNSMTTDLDSVKNKQESIKADIESFDIKNAGSIVNPITTTIEPISADKSRITFAFPSLFILIVLFVGIMLSGTIVFMEKDSRAFFRTFTTPAKNTFFAFMAYITSLLIIMLQIALVLVVVYLALQVPVFANLHITLIMLFLTMTVFILLGMFIGHLFDTSEGITMSTITVSSVLIFLSNLILPIETLSPTIQNIIRFNPYVIASEGMRKAMLFNAGFKTLWIDMLILLSYIIIIMVAMIGAMKFSSSKLLQKLHMRAHAKIISVPEQHYLNIDKYGLTIKSLHELLVAIQSFNDEDYKALIKPKNIFADWISKTYKARGLALKMRTKQRAKAISLLETYLEKKH